MTDSEDRAATSAAMEAKEQARLKAERDRVAEAEAREKASKKAAPPSAEEIEAARKDDAAVAAGTADAATKARVEARRKRDEWPGKSDAQRAADAEAVKVAAAAKKAADEKVKAAQAAFDKAKADLEQAQKDAVKAGIVPASKAASNVDRVVELATHISAQAYRFGECGSTLKLTPEKDSLSAELAGFVAAVKQFKNVSVELVKDADGKTDIVHVVGSKGDR